MRRRPTVDEGRRVADRRSPEPSPPGEPGEPIAWWQELIDEPARGDDADADELEEPEG